MSFFLHSQLHHGRDLSKDTRFEEDKNERNEGEETVGYLGPQWLEHETNMELWVPSSLIAVMRTVMANVAVDDTMTPIAIMKVVTVPFMIANFGGPIRGKK